MCFKQWLFYRVCGICINFVRVVQWPSDFNIFVYAGLWPKILSVKIRCLTNACVKQIKVLLLSKFNSVTNRFWPSSGGALVYALCLTNVYHKFFIVWVTCSLTKMAYTADVLFPVEVSSAGHCHRLHLLLTMNDWWWLWPDWPFSSVLGAITTRTQTRP